MLDTAPQLPASPDYPAAHSMDVRWFGVDEDGELGFFQPAESGVVPLLNGIATEEELRSPNPLRLSDNHVPRAYERTENALRKRFYCIDDDCEYENLPPEEDAELTTLKHLLWLPFDYGRPYVFERMHFYRTAYDEVGGFYVWRYSPANPLRLEDLPSKLRSPASIVHLKDFKFGSREPLNPYDHASNCFSSFKWRVAVLSHAIGFPVPNSRDLWDLDFSEKVYQQLFIAADAHGRLAIFGSGSVGACPRDPAHHVAATAWWRSQPRSDARLGDPAAPLGSWFEAPFHKGPLPRQLGFYHYDMSWFHCGPYLRVAEPDPAAPALRLTPELARQLAPIEMPWADFERDAMIQPMQDPRFDNQNPAFYHEIALPYRAPEFWIDARLERIVPRDRFTIRFSPEADLLRDARRFYAMAASLRRDPNQPPSA